MEVLLAAIKALSAGPDAELLALLRSADTQSLLSSGASAALLPAAAAALDPRAHSLGLLYVLAAQCGAMIGNDIINPAPADAGDGGGGSSSGGGGDNGGGGGGGGGGAVPGAVADADLPAFFDHAAALLRRCHPPAVRRDAPRFAALCRRYTQLLVAHGCPLRGVLPLRAAIDAVTAQLPAAATAAAAAAPTSAAAPAAATTAAGSGGDEAGTSESKAEDQAGEGEAAAASASSSSSSSSAFETLCPQHVDFTQCCLLAQCHHAALPVISRPVFGYCPAATAVRPTDVLRYHYHAGMLQLGLKDWTAAAAALSLVIAVPAQAASAVAVAAYKKLVLATLIADGGAAGLVTTPRGTAPVVARALAELAAPYVALAAAAKKLDAAECGRIVLEDHAPPHAQLHAQLHTGIVLEDGAAAGAVDAADAAAAADGGGGGGDAATFRADGNWGLAKQALRALLRRRIARLTATYVALPLARVAEQVRLLVDAWLACWLLLLRLLRLRLRLRLSLSRLRLRACTLLTDHPAVTPAAPFLSPSVRFPARFPAGGPRRRRGGGRVRAAVHGARRRHLGAHRAGRRRHRHVRPGRRRPRRGRGGRGGGGGEGRCGHGGAGR
jgi:hypothetical protein